MATIVWANIPDDVLINIFLKLPARSLLPLRLVCKHWLGIIRNPNFIRLHLNHPTNNPNNDDPIIIMSWAGQDVRGNNNYAVTILYDDDDDENPTYDFDVPLNDLFLSVQESPYCLHGPCNGLFLIYGRVDTVIFNPTTRKYRKVPRSPLRPDCSKPYSLGFGFDSVLNEYKVATFTRYPPYNVEIFSLTTNQWREVKNVVNPCKDDDMSRMSLEYIFLNGAFHWLGKYEILVFELNEETFESYKLPLELIGDAIIFTETRSLDLSVLNEFLALIVHTKFWCDVIRYELDIWVMKEYGVYESWSILYRFNMDMHIIQGPLSISNDGELLLEDNNNKLESFNLNTNEIKGLKVGWPENAYRYRESLISLK